MPQPSAVSKALRKTATKLARVTDDTTREAAEFAVVEAQRVGGTMTPRRYKLYAVVASVSNKAGRSSVVIAGVPAGFWAIKSYGRTGGYTVRPRREGGVVNLRGAGLDITAAASAVPGPASGDGRWDRVIDAVSERSAAVFVERVDKALEV